QAPPTAVQKVLVFAHAPPPHHGQSVMVEILLASLRTDPRFEVHHVDVRVSDNLSDLGSFRPQKLFRLLSFILKAWWLRLRHGPMAFYYVPAPVKRSAIYRDWLVMAMCRPFFSKIVLHWHAYGLGEWSTAGNSVSRKLTRFLLKNASLSIVTTEHNRRDAEFLSPRRVEVVPNGIADPCPDFDASVLPARARRASDSTKRCLFLAHCTEEKGLFDALDAFAHAKAMAWHERNERLEMTVAGSFVREDEHARFRELIAASEFRHDDGACAVSVVGFLDPTKKDRAFREHDCLVFPSHWESFGLTVLEAASYGMPSVVSEHPNLTSLLPADLSFAAPYGNSKALGEAILEALHFRKLGELRSYFGRHYLSSAFSARICDALASV
ncbi:MAG: glycosyltransferase family 4 protein, partial [Chthoniobacterales bacterium]